MDPRMEACTIFTWPLLRVKLLVLDCRFHLNRVIKVNHLTNYDPVSADATRLLHRQANLQENHLHNVAQADVQKRANRITRLKSDPLSSIREERRQRHNGERVDGKDDDGRSGGAVCGDAHGHTDEQAIDVGFQDHVADGGDKGGSLCVVGMFSVATASVTRKGIVV